MDLEEAQRWVAGKLAAGGGELTGDLELVRSRPWGEVARAESSDGAVWLKAPGKTTAFEVPLYALLDEVSPGSALSPIGVDEDRGWVLLPDGGAPFGDSASGAELVEGMTAALVRYAQLQRDVEPHLDRLIAMGLADMRPQAMLGRFDEAVEFSRSFAANEGSESDADSVEKVAAERETFAAWASELAEAPGGASLDHNDLHPWNVLGDPKDPQSIRFYDWGDATIAHPFAAVALPLGMIANEDPDALEPARDAYLEAFADLGSHDELVRVLELACRCAKVARAHTWERAMRLAGDDAEEDFRRAPLESLESVLDEGWTSRT